MMKMKRRQGGGGKSQINNFTLCLKEVKKIQKEQVNPNVCITKDVINQSRNNFNVKAVRGKKQITYKGKPIKITGNFSMETFKARRAWSEVFWTQNENNFSPRILYPTKLSFKIDGEIKVFHDKQKLKQYMTTKPPLQKILQGILHTESESKQNHEKAGNTKPQESKRQENRE
jgi:hypothetical protein